MRGKALSFLVSFALVLSLALPLGAAEVWRGPSSLEVRVEDSSGKAVEGAKVRLLYQAVEPKSGPAIASTDGDGEASFFTLAEGWWALEVTKEGALSIHSEFVLSGEKKPAVLSTFQEKTPGATQTLQVRIGRPRAGRAAGDPTGGPRVGRPAAPAPVAPAPVAQPVPAVQPSAPAATPAPSAPAPSAPPSAPSPAPVLPQAPAEKPAPAPSAAPALPSTPPAQPTPPPAAAPSPSPAPVPTAPPVVAPQEKPATPPAPPAPAPSVPTPIPAPAVAPPSVPTPIPPPAPPVVVPVPVAPATPVPAVLPEPKAQRRSYAERSCLECKAGEEALSIEVSVPPGSAPCGEGLETRLRERDPDKAEAGLPPSCRLLRVVLPPNARFTGYRFEVEDGGASRDCRAGADCPVGTCRFPLDPGIRKSPAGTAFTAAFENTSPDRERRAIFTVYFAPEG